MTPRPARSLLYALLALVGGYVAITGYFYLNQRHFIMPQTVSTMAAAPSTQPARFQTLSIPTADGDATLHGVLFPAAVSSPTLVLAFGGNAHDVVGFATFLKNTVFPQGDVAVAALSYRGYPNSLGMPSTGLPSQQALYADSLTVFDTLNAQLKPAHIHAIGYSLGTAVATYLGTMRPLASLTLVAPPASVEKIAEGEYPWLPVKWLIKYPFDTEHTLPQVPPSIPVTMVYTPTDGLIPPGHITNLLHNARPSAAIVKVEGSRHGNILDNPAMPAVLRRAVLGPSATTPQALPITGAHPLQPR